MGTGSAGALRVEGREAWLVRALLPGVVALYVVLAAAGHTIFVTKTLILPVLLLYGGLTRDREAFARDWLPLITAVVLFDACRGAIFVLVQQGIRPVFQHYVIVLERMLSGTPALSATLQEHWRSDLLDRFFVALHGSHFLLFLVFGLVVWHRRRDVFPRYRAALIAVMYVGLILYVAAPTAPPWLAAHAGAIPDVAHISQEVYALRVPAVLVAALDTNPVAAMPSLHTAVPAVCALFAWSILGRAACVAMTAYALSMGFGLIYLGEHYLADVLAGFALAAGAYCLVPRMRAAADITLWRAATDGLVKVGATFLLGVATAAWRL